MRTRFFTLLGCLGFALTAWSKTPVVLSTDVGNEIDDQWAITYLLLSDSFDVRGIISAHGPTLPDPSAHATYRVLRDVVEHRLAMGTHPPLFEGSSQPLANRETPRKNAAVDFLIETSRPFNQQNRLTVFTIGAATDVASAILQDPEISERIAVVAMGFKSLTEGGKEFNIENDPHAWQAILASKVPVTIGAADVCQRDLAIGFEQARKLLTPLGAIGQWLWSEYQDWYFRNIKPIRKNDFSKPWIIWDIVTMAYSEGLTKQQEIPRPHLADDLRFVPGKNKSDTISWITAVDSARLWDNFARRVEYYQSTHRMELFTCATVQGGEAAKE